MILFFKFKRYAIIANLTWKQKSCSRKIISNLKEKLKDLLKRLPANPDHDYERLNPNVRTKRLSMKLKKTISRLY